MFHKILAPLFISPFPIKKWSIRDDTLGSWIKKLPKCPVFVAKILWFLGIPISTTLSASVWRRLASPVVCSSWRSRQALHVVAGEDWVSINRGLWKRYRNAKNTQKNGDKSSNPKICWEVGNLEVRWQWKSSSTSWNKNNVFCIFLRTSAILL